MYWRRLDALDHLSSEQIERAIQIVEEWEEGTHESPAALIAALCPVLLNDTREQAQSPELSIVALRHSHECEGGVLPEGAKGTVVHAYREGVRYEVEFVEPFHCVVTVRPDDIRPV